MYKILKLITVCGLVLLFAGEIGCGEDAQYTGDTDDTSENGTDGDADGDSDADTDIDPNVSACSSAFTVDASISTAISTVGIVEWSTTAAVSNAAIAFGPDTNYGYSAPVDLTEANYRTLLLGMKPSSTYHYRILIDSGGTACGSPDYTITTGAAPTNLPNKVVTTQNEAALAGGFVIAESGGTAFILDKDGDYVWWYAFTGDNGGMGGGMGLSRAHISGDGKSMWAANVNVQGGTGALYRIGLDGLGTQETLNIERHHDFCVLPDNSIAYIQFTDSDGDQIVERTASGTTRTVYTMSDDFTGGGGGMGGSGDWSHCNAIHYVPSEDAFTMSCLNLNNIIMVDRSSGTLLWSVDGDGNEGDFNGVSWNRQHGHHYLDNGSLLFFNNNGDAAAAGGGGSDPAAGGRFGGGNSTAAEVSLNTGTWQASLTWIYDGNSSSGTEGDVQRLSNGNTLVTYSNSALIHEVDASKSLVRTIAWSGGALGYADWRLKLYGAPERY